MNGTKATTFEAFDPRDGRKPILVVDGDALPDEATVTLPAPIVAELLIRNAQDGFAQGHAAGLVTPTTSRVIRRVLRDEAGRVDRVVEEGGR